MSTIEKTAVVEAVEDTAKTTKTTKKTPAKKAATKKAAEKVEAVETEKKTATRKKTATAKVYVQWEGTEVMIADIVEKIKAEYKAEHDDVIASFDIYVKPEEKMAYYVINETEGKIEL